MTKQFVFSTAILLLATAGAAQEGLKIPANGNPSQLAEQAREVYLAACATVQQEFGHPGPLRPKVTLILGGAQDGVWRDTGEIRLRKWNRDLFAQGVVILAFGELMPSEQKLAMAKRAVSWADATIGVRQLQK